MWLSKRLYESLPFAYMAAGAALIAVSVLLGGGLASLLLTLLGVAGLTGGLVVLLRRYGYRASRSRSAFDERG